MMIVILLSANALLGLAAGLMFGMWVNLLIAPIVAFGSAVALQAGGVELFDGMLVTFGCLFVSQSAYLVGAFLAPPSSTESVLAEMDRYLSIDVPDDEPGGNGQQAVSEEQENERGEHPARPSPPQA